MEPTPTKHIFAAYAQPRRIITTLVCLGLLLVFLYFYIGRMTFVLWVLSAGIVIAFVQAVRQLSDRGPCLVITDEGINDKRLGMGLIRWSDVKQVRMQGVGGAYFISLDLANREQYLSRLPAFTRISNQIWRLYNVSPIHIKVAYMDVSPDEMFEMIMSEVELNRSRS
jgi:hypothetical protein